MVCVALSYQSQQSIIIVVKIPQQVQEDILLREADQLNFQLSKNNFMKKYMYNSSASMQVHVAISNVRKFLSSRHNYNSI